MESHPVTPSNMYTWNYIREHIEGIEIARVGRAIKIRASGLDVTLPPYPEIEHVRILRRDGILIPEVPSNWVAQWKANGSNIRIYSVRGEIIAVSRGGFLLDWKPYIALVRSPLKDILANALEEENFVLFGELVGPQSLVRICPKYWREYIGGDIGYLLFDIYDLEHQRFLDLRFVERFGEENVICAPLGSLPGDYEIRGCGKLGGDGKYAKQIR